MANDAGRSHQQLARRGRPAAPGRRERWQREGERSIGQNLAMIGALGWTIVTPTLIGIFVGRWLDRISAIGIFWTLACSSPACVSAARWRGSGVIGNDRRPASPMLLRVGAPFVLLGALLGAGYFAALQAGCRAVPLRPLGRPWPVALTSAGCCWQASAFS